MGQTSFLDYLLGQFQSYQSNRPLSRVQFGMNEIVRQRVTPLIKPPVPLTIDATGLAPYPTDFEQGDAMWTNTNTRIRFVPQHKLFSYLNSQIDPIATNPIFLIQSNGFQFYPNTNFNGVSIPNVTLSYVGTPPAILWSSTPDANGRPIYNPGLSVSPVWYNVDMLEIITRALKFVGLNLQLPELNQYATQIQTQGQ